MRSPYYTIEPGHAEQFVAAGYKQRHFFPHDVFRVPKCGPDGFRLSGWMCEVDDPDAMWELVLYADPAVAQEFPRELFFDDEVIWHQQQFGLAGQVATASLVLDGDTVYSLTHVSDLFQRISRRRQHKTRVEKVFAGWNHMLLNAVLAFALERGARRIRIPTAALASRHTDRSRTVDFTIFERIYDHTVTSLFPARADGDWWTLELYGIRDRVIVPERRERTSAREKCVCLCHDVEQGLGHRRADPHFARRADRDSANHLLRMLETEADAGVSATYCVVGTLFDSVRAEVARDGHCVAFHSFDHDQDTDQLLRCREVDYRIKGYRPPNSRITAELSDRNLLFHNFEWLASSPHSIDAETPALRAGIVRLPIAMDDFPLHTGALSYEDWERGALAVVAENEFTAISLHDCYGSHWLPKYRSFISRVNELARLRTLDDVAAEVTLASAA